MAVQDLTRIEEKLDKVVAGAVAVSDSVGGILFQDMAQVMEFAKLLSLSGTAIPKHLRGNPGGCLAVTIQALEWRMSPIAVANKSYEVNDRIAYESQLIHAVVEARAPLKERLRERYEGEGVERCCIVTGHFRGEVEPRELRSPTVGKIKVKNSPLWTADVDQQLFYYTTRVWARRHCPDVILGIFSDDELERDHIGAENARDVTPSPGLKERLKGGKGRGFSGAHVETEAAKIAAPVEPIQAEIVASDPGSGQAPKGPAVSPEAPAGPASSEGET